MVAKSRLFAAAALVTVALVSFFAGRDVEERALAAKAHANAPASTSPPPAINPGPPSHRHLAVAEILALPFADFYEALRSAPSEARKKWATELEAMPEGPRRAAAFSGFYKLLVQFDPAAAAQAITEIKDKRAQNLALAAAIDAAPGFALPMMAELTVKREELPDRFWEVLSQWTAVDPAAAARFLDEHGRGEHMLAYRDLITDWAALDPDAARRWLENKGISEVPELRRSFIGGWYENDRTAAISYVLAHVDDPDMHDLIGDILRSLYFDSKEEARKFIESLPDDKRRHDAFRAAIKSAVHGEEEETGDPKRTPRAVAEWITEFPPAYWKGTLTQIFNWSRKPPQAMLAWIEQQPLAIREAVAAEYTAPFEVPTREAIMPVLQVADPLLRDQLLRALLKHADAVPAEIRATVTTASLSSEQKNHVFQIIAAVEAEKARDYGSEK